MSVNKYSLSLTGVNCMNCVGKITTALREHDPDISFVINDNKDRADLISALEPNQAVDIIQETGDRKSVV